MLNLQGSVKDIMSKELITLNKSDTLDKVKEIFDTNMIHHIPVVNSGELEGMISQSDFLFFQRGFSPSEEKYDQYRLKTHYVYEIMTTGLAKIDVSDKISVALEIFKENLFHAIPIMKKGRLAGIVTTYDVIKALADNKGAVNQLPSS